MALRSQNRNVDIFVYGVKAFTPLVTNPVYKILVHNDDEESKFHTELPIYRDYDGDNISDKNLVFNEYTGLYWVWKNWDLKDYVGCNHYRRYYKCLDNLPNINEIFKKHSIILNEKFPLRYEGVPKTNREFYEIWHNVEDFDLMGNIVKELYPEYSNGWDKMSNATHIYPSSIFIMRRSTFLKYMKFIFDVANEFNKRRNCYTDTDYIKYVEGNKDKYIRAEHAYYNVKMQARVVGYLIERCLCAFLMSGKESLESRSYQMPWDAFSVEYNEK